MKFSRAFLGRLLAILLIVAALWSAGYMLVQGGLFPKTEDAVVTADYIRVAPQVAGMITHLYVQENQAVAKGDLLFELDARSFKLAVELIDARRETLLSTIAASERKVMAGKTNVEIAHANIKRALSAQKFAQKTLKRITPLHDKGFVTNEDYDAVVTDVLQSNADVLAAELALKASEQLIPDIEPLRREMKSLDIELAVAKLELSHTRVYAPFDGRVVNLLIREGQYAVPGIPLFTLLDTSDWYVTANYRETDLHSIHVGAPVRVRLNAYPERHFTGTVESIGWATETNAIIREQLSPFPYVREDLDWVRLAKRFPVRIHMDGLPPDQPWFRSGESAVVVIETEKHGALVKQ